MEEYHHVKCPYCSEISCYLKSSEANTIVRCKALTCGKRIGWDGLTIEEMQAQAIVITTGVSLNPKAW